MRFPVVTIRDMVRAQKRLLDALGVQRLALVTGGSIGGQQALEWAVEYPDFVKKAVPVAATGALGPQGVGMSEIGRRAIMADPDWQDGDYYGTGRSPDEGLAIARMAGMMTYQSAAGQWERFGRRPARASALYPEFGGRFEIESYLHYQGRELTGRFDANSYLYLSRAMDLYDVASGYESEEEAYSRIQAEVLFVGITSDWLFPAAEVRDGAEKAREAGAEAHYAEIDYTKRPRRLPEGLERTERSDTTVPGQNKLIAERPKGATNDRPDRSRSATTGSTPWRCTPGRRWTRRRRRGPSRSTSRPLTSSTTPTTRRTFSRSPKRATSTPGS